MRFNSKVLVENGDSKKRIIIKNSFYTSQNYEKRGFQD